jgi:hypothetical protein
MVSYHSPTQRIRVADFMTNAAKPDDDSLNVDRDGYLTDRYGDLTVFWRPELSGGGRTFGQQIVEFVGDRLGPAECAFEWCCGPGFIGFSLLAAGLCRRLILADVNPAAVAAVQRTIDYNKIGHRVRVYVSDGLDDVPQDERWDLAVGNPPHINEHPDIPDFGKPPIIYMDPGWGAHRAFYARVRDWLRLGANVVVQEDSRYSEPDDFREMVRTSGLTWVDTTAGRDGLYFVWAVNL